MGLQLGAHVSQYVNKDSDSRSIGGPVNGYKIGPKGVKSEEKRDIIEARR